jgi:hypothetical protein
MQDFKIQLMTLTVVHYLAVTTSVHLPVIYWYNSLFFQKDGIKETHETAEHVDEML